jgi:hypothetical protein
MTHDELIASIERMMNHDAIFMKDALRAVVELHKPKSHQNDNVEGCVECSSFSYRYVEYPCPTIKAIEKELQ